MNETTANSLPFEPVSAYYSGATKDALQQANCRGKRIGILIVTYNAVSTLAKVLRRIPPEVWDNVEEVAVFDDASQDATYELAVGLKTLRNLPKLEVLKHDRNLGYGGNQKAGYRHFIERGFDIVVLLHGDGQYAPEILSRIYRQIVEGSADAVFGSRMLAPRAGALRGGMPLYKYVGNRILSKFENWALGMNLTEFHSGYRAYNLHALRKIDFSAMTDDFHFDTEIIIKLHHQAFVIREVPIPTYYGTEICYVDGLKYARNVVRSVRRYKQTCRSVRSYPEFREYFQHYPLKQSRDSSHDYVRRLVGANQDVLDVACGEGALAAELQRNGNRVTGVDLLRDVAHPEAFEGYFSADLEQGLAGVIDRLGDRQFDCVLLLDILEHLKSSDTLLMQCHRMLRPTGRLIVSLPNVAVISVRLALLFGRFDYTERGVLDKTHVRFFTRKTARRLLKDQSFEILTEKMTLIPLELVVGWSPDNWLMRGLNRLLALITWLLPGLFGYQMMFVGRSRRSATTAR